MLALISELSPANKEGPLGMFFCIKVGDKRGLVENLFGFSKPLRRGNLKSRIYLTDDF